MLTSNRRQTTAILVAGVAFGCVALRMGLSADPFGPPKDQSRKVAKTESNTEIVIPDAQVSLIEQVEVPAQESGVLSTIIAREGMTIREGQVIGQIDDAESQLEKRRAEIEMDIAQRDARNDVRVRLASKTAEVRKAELARSEEAADRVHNVVSKTELEKLRLEVQRSQLEIEQAKHDLDLAELNFQLKQNEHAQAARSVERRRITAPLDSFVVEVNKRRGEWVKPGDIVCRLLRLDRLRVKGIVRLADVLNNPTGQPVVLEVTLASGEVRKYPGKVVFVSPEVNAVNGDELELWAEVENTDQNLRPGMTGRLIINRDIAGYDAETAAAEQERQ
ncbi:efflux RND transporter periplasmic adaptor subunit [Thalassoroseus pseudoceratinae]|uniref:efflux RND transporter periplasmic adaptor subunit n=1 Tax=Thalassoroseus pseudoceratinae TaxID=2713176 RepID=UPI00141D9BC4|nr:efflux RND transporter periplasmic adaptor subunit [Thalassoroseus pseudoceratinae]